MLNELDNFNSSSLLPVGDLQPGEGVALTSEVVKVVSKRRGSVLAAQTILKYDHFPGCQKLSLPERLDGAPNFRGVNFYELDKSLSLPLQSPNRQSSFVYGVAMPTRDAIKIVLRHVGAARDCSKKLLWISLREEPVLYVNGKPYVLRMFQEPIKNLETTGIERERVELMESRMKDDVLNELSLYGGRLLLHEEETVSGGFAIVVRSIFGKMTSYSFSLLGKRSELKMFKLLRKCSSQFKKRVFMLSILEFQCSLS